MQSYLEASLSFIESEEMRDYLYEELPKFRWAAMDCAHVVAYAPAPIERKLPVLEQIAQEAEPELADDGKPFTKRAVQLARSCRTALEERYSGPEGSMFWLQASSCDGDRSCLFENDFFTEFDAALRYLEQLETEYPADYAFEGLSYTITKHVPNGKGELKEYCTWYLNNTRESNDDDPSVADLQFDEDGEALCFWSREVLFDEEKNGYFTYVFYEVPNPFEQGDIVKQAGSEDYGIVENSQEQWKEALARYQSDEWKQKWKGFGPDYSDVQISVTFLGADGTFGHAHVNPIVLELYQPKTSQSPMDQLLLSASNLYKGKGSLDELYYATMAYRNATRK